MNTHSTPLKMWAPAMFIILLAFVAKGQGNSEDALKDVFKGKFYIGGALNRFQIDGKDPKSMALAEKHFNSITAENCMKSGPIQPKEGQFDFKDADRFVEYGVKNNLHMVGHALIWHTQAPDWFFTDKNGKDVSRDVMIERMRKHIHTVVGRYKGRIHGWDVVNEAIEDDGSWRKNKFYEIVGEEYVALAFKFAREADPDAELYYNDYSMAHEGRRNGVVKMVKSLQAQGIKVDGIGMQGHFTMDFPTLEAFEKSILAFAGLGVTVMITELDMTVLPFPFANQGADVGQRAEYQAKMNPYTAGLPSEVADAWDQRMTDFFRLFLKHHDKISRVTFWGVSDNTSWKNNWPVRGRTDYPLLFDRNFQPKPAFNMILKEVKAAR